MKHLRIVLSLLVVVVAMSVAVFAVENALRDDIDLAAANRANEAKDAVLPGALASGYNAPNELDSDQYDAGNSGITGIFFYPDLGYVYQVEFKGHVDKVTYMLGFDEDGNVTGYQTLAHKETAGLGAKIADPQYWTQFLDKTLDDLAVGDIDGWAGATSTTEKWQASLMKVVEYHYESFLGIETFDITNSLSGLPSGVYMVEEVQQHGVVIEYTFYVEFTGYNTEEPTTYKFTVNAEDHSIKSLVILETFESAGIGEFIADPEFAAQFVNMTKEAATANDFDDVGGSTYPVTLAGFTESFNATFFYYREEIEGYTVPTPVDITDDFWGLPDSISKIESLTVDGVVTEYILTVNFQGYVNEDSVFTVTVNAADHSIIGIEFLVMNETTGVGSSITELAFIEQFNNMTKEDATNGEYDALGGVTYPVTFGGFDTAFYEAFVYYRVEVEGYVVPVETLEEKLIRLHEELSTEGVTYTDISDQFTLTDGIGINKVEQAGSIYFFTAQFGGFYGEPQPVTILVAIDSSTNKLTGLRVIEQNETAGIGANIETDDYLANFTDISYLLPYFGEIEAISGASITTGGLRGALEEIAQFYRTEALGLDPLGASFDFNTFLAEKVVEIYPTATYTVDVTTSYPADYIVDGIYEVYDATDTLLGYIFDAEAEGANIASNPTFIKFIIAVNEDRTFEGFYLYADNETDGLADSYYEAAYSALYDAIDIESDTYAIDATAGATYTHDAILAAAREVAKYYVEDMLNQEFARPASQTVSNSELLAAYPGASTFEEVYLDYPYQDGIRNIYAAKDGTGTIIGYVYYGYEAGTFLNVEYTWGVSTTGLTQQLNIIADGTSWDWAPDYSGGEVFASSSFLGLYEGIQIDSILASEVNIDSWAGVSTTTGGMRDALEAIAQYHGDNNVGGGN